jgi:hypothetical protein
VAGLHKFNVLQTKGIGRPRVLRIQQYNIMTLGILTSVDHLPFITVAARLGADAALACRAIAEPYFAFVRGCEQKGFNWV